jgi:hypothetical protein
LQGIRGRAIFVSTKRNNHQKQDKMATLNDLKKVWKNLDQDEKLEIIEQGINYCSVSEGSLFLRYYAKDRSIAAHVQTKPDNHLCVEAVSQDTLSTLFSDDHDYEEEDAEVILNWMESQA